MYYIVSYIEGTQVVYCELFTLFHCAADTYTVEAVKNLMVCIDADFILVVYKTGMKVFSGYELRKNRPFFLHHYRAQPFQLAFLLSYYINLISAFQS